MYLMEKHFESRMMGILLCALIIMIDHISFVWIILKAISFILSVLYKFIFRYACIFRRYSYKLIIIEIFANRETMRDGLYYIKLISCEKDL